MLKLSHRLFLATLGCGLFGGACSGDDVAPLEPVDYEVTIAGFNGRDADTADLRCDGTLSVAVTIAPTDTFTLRPANACGAAPRCGYVHFEGLTESGEVLASVDSATVQGVLVFSDTSRYPELATIRASLRHGTDQTPVLNADGTEAAGEAQPMFTLPQACEDGGEGGSGAGGAAAGGAGGSAGEPAEPELGGAGGAAAGAAQGGAGGENPGGAGAGGA